MNLTNEKLVELIKEGDTGLLPQLWEQVRKFIVMMAKKHYNKLENKYGCELEDLIQSGYFGLLAAIEYYEPGKYKFLTYLDLNLKTAFNEALGIRRYKRDWLDYSTSLDMPIGAEGDTALIDMLGDMTPATADITNSITENVFNAELREALDASMEVLNTRQKDIINLHYYFGLRFSQIAEIKGTTHQNIFNQHEEALYRIYNSKYRKILEEFISHNDEPANPYKKTGLGYWKDNNTSAVEAFLLHNINYLKYTEKKEKTRHDVNT